jgi:hypothetical protein
LFAIYVQINGLWNSLSFFLGDDNFMQKKYLASLLIIFLLGACHTSPTYQYLMEHPAELEKEAAHCSGADPSAECDIVRQAAHDFIVMVNERNRDPESFGSSILQAQQKLATLRDDIKRAEENYQTLLKTQATKEKLETQEKFIEGLKEASVATSDHVKTLLAVVAATSSE